MHSKGSLCSWPYRCSEPGTLLRLGSMEPGGDGTSNFHSATLVPTEKKFSVAHTCFCPKSPFPSGRLDPSGYFSYAAPATSTMSNFLYTLTSSTTTHFSYMEVFTTHAHQTSRCSPRVLDWLAAVFSAPRLLRFRGKPKKSLA